MSASAARTPAAKRLLALPAVFSPNDLSLGQSMDPGAARVALARWRAEGYAEPAGPRLGLWYNLLKDPSGADGNLGTVLKRQFGSPVVIGPSALNDASWTTQTPRVLTVAVPMARSYARVDGVSVYGRPPEWFSRVLQAWKGSERGRNGLPKLPPEFALADALAHGDCLHHLAPDDIEIPDDRGDAGALMEAFGTFEVPEDVYGPYLEASGIQPTLALAGPTR